MNPVAKNPRHPTHVGSPQILIAREQREEEKQRNASKKRQLDTILPEQQVRNKRLKAIAARRG